MMNTVSKEGVKMRKLFCELCGGNNLINKMVDKIIRRQNELLQMDCFSDILLSKADADSPDITSALTGLTPMRLGFL